MKQHSDNEPEIYDFGIWAEIIGFLMVFALSGFLLLLADGIF